MADYGFVARLLAVLHSLPLWLFVALAAAGYGALFLPAFGGADIVELRQQWAPYFWLDATTFTVFALSCAADLMTRGRTYTLIVDGVSAYAKRYGRLLTRKTAILAANWTLAAISRSSSCGM
jgi:hypothetical protein